MKKILKEGHKEPLHFKCSYCKCEWEDDDWKMVEERNHFGTFLFTGSVKTLPMSYCPTCGWKSQNYNKGE